MLREVPFGGVPLGTWCSKKRVYEATKVVYDAIFALCGRYILLFSLFSAKYSYTDIMSALNKLIKKAYLLYSVCHIVVMPTDNVFWNTLRIPFWNTLYLEDTLKYH